jgi:hypothetical protein
MPNGFDRSVKELMRVYEFWAHKFRAIGRAPSQPIEQSESAVAGRAFFATGRRSDGGTLAVAV